MPPSSGKRDESSPTTSPCGTKKKSAARSHSAIALGPALAAVASHLSPSTATRLNSTRSRSPRARFSETAPAERSLARCSGAPGELTAYFFGVTVSPPMWTSRLWLTRSPTIPSVFPRWLTADRGDLLVVDEQPHRVRLRRVDRQLVRRLAARVLLVHRGTVRPRNDLVDVRAGAVVHQVLPVAAHEEIRVVLRRRVEVSSP